MAKKYCKDCIHYRLKVIHDKISACLHSSKEENAHEYRLIECGIKTADYFSQETEENIKNRERKSKQQPKKP